MSSGCEQEWGRGEGIWDSLGEEWRTGVRTGFEAL